jgi:hypothetical protein
MRAWRPSRRAAAVGDRAVSSTQRQTISIRLPVPYLERQVPITDLERFFTENQGRHIHKWKHYFEIYERHFSRFRGAEVHVVEFGVAQGGSLQMWKLSSDIRK